MKSLKEKNKKIAAGYKAAKSAHNKAVREATKAQAAEKALAKVQAMEAKLKAHDIDLKALGVKPKAKAKPKKPAEPVDIVEAVTVSDKKRKAPAKKTSAKKKK